MCKEYERATRRALLHVGRLGARGAGIGRVCGLRQANPYGVTACLLVE